MGKPGRIVCTTKDTLLGVAPKPSQHWTVVMARERIKNISVFFNNNNYVYLEWR